MRAWSAPLSLLGLGLGLLGPVAAETAPAVPTVERKELGELRTEGIPEIPPALEERMRQYLNTRGAALQGWDPVSGGVFITTRFAETAQVHRVASPGAARFQLTFFDERVGGFHPHETEPVAVYSRDVGGSENFQLFLFDLRTGTSQLLTDGRNRFGAASWSNDGTRLSYYGTARNQRDWDVYIDNPFDPAPAELVYEGAPGWVPGSWSPDDTRLLLYRSISATRSEIYLFDLATKQLTPVLPHGDGILYGGAFWAPDGKSLYLTSNEGSEFVRLRHYDLATGQSKVITSSLNWDVEDGDLDPTGRFLAFSVNEDGFSRLYLLELATGQYRPVPGLPVGLIGGLEFDPKGERLGLVLNTAQTPSDVFSLDIATGALTRWTTSEVGGLDTSRFILPELIRYPTFDTVDGAPRQIPAWYYRPRGEGPFPVVINIHGGPEAQSLPGFNSTYQFYLNELGVAVLDPNVRGSSGYGKTYLNLDNGMLREDSVKDIGALLDWIAAQPELDASRVVVAGGSYGGYMVNACLVHYGDRLAGGISSVGISHFVTFLESTAEYRRDLRRVEYGDERIPEMREFLNRISPLTNAHRIRKPFFVVQGYNDPRVPYTESEQIVAAARASGAPVWYLLAMNEGHGFAKKSNSDYLRLAMVMFLKDVLLEQPSS